MQGRIQEGKMKADPCGYMTQSWFFLNADPGSGFSKIFARFSK